MQRVYPSKRERTKRISGTRLLKLVVVLAFFVGAGVYTKSSYFALFVLASLGIFFAEHFAKSRRLELLYLIGLPTLFWILVTIFSSNSGGLSDWLPSARWNDFASGMTVVLLTATLATAASAMSAIAVCLLCGLIYRLTGIRLLKFDWRK